MPSLQFYAAREDLCCLFEFLFSEMDVHIFEPVSAYDTKLREFKGIDDIKELGQTLPSACFALWFPHVMSSLYVKKIEVSPETCSGHTFRYILEGGGLMQLSCGGILPDEKRQIRAAKLQYFTPGDARKSGWDAEVEWNRLRAYARRIERYVSRQSPAMVQGMSILPSALLLIESGYEIRLDSSDAVVCSAADVAYKA